MASADFDTFGNAPYLNSNEQNLLLNALKSNKGGDGAQSPDGTLNPDLTQLAPDTGFFDPSLLEGTDFPNDFNWDIDGNTLDDLRNDNGHPSSQSAEGDDASPASMTDGKRKEHPDDDDEEGSGKRRDGEEKVAKKPGRKPLTSEPTSKRKAQNRAAQRAFRERKEKHLRDLETKVEDLEKASEATNHENGVLRAQVDKLNAELSEYKKRLSSTASPVGYSPNSNSRMNWDIGNFNFEFPNLGFEPNDKSKTATKAKECVNSLQALKALDDLEKSSAEQDFYRTGSVTGFSLNNSPSPLSGSRTMSMSTSIGGSTYSAANKQSRSPTNSTDKSGSNSASPASLGLGSSCVTTPEACADSPQNKLTDNVSFDQRASISPNQPKTPGNDIIPGLDWFASQNKGAFDPILFGDYREPQDNILNQPDLGLGAFDNDTFPWNLDSNVSVIWPTTEALEPALPPKKTLMDQVEQAALGNDVIHKDAFTTTDYKTTLTCAKLWDRVQRSEKVLSGEADMDDLCSQLKAKAKCGGPNKGAVVDEADVDAILGPDPAKKKPTGMWSMFS